MDRYNKSSMKNEITTLKPKKEKEKSSMKYEQITKG